MPIYTAESSILAPLDVIRRMITGFRGSNYIAYRMFVKDIRTDYAKSKYGIIWDFIDPIVLALIFWALSYIRIIKLSTISIPYALFVIYGFLLYQSFFDAVVLPIDIQGRMKSIVTQIKVAPEVLILTVIFRLLFNHGIRLIILLVFTLCLIPPKMPDLRFWEPAPPTAGVEAVASSSPHAGTTDKFISVPSNEQKATEEAATQSEEPSFSLWGFVKMLFLSVLILLIGLPIGLILAPFNIIYADVGKLIRIVLNPLRYLSPVMYPLPMGSLAGKVMMLNPVAPILDGLRSLGTLNQWLHLIPSLLWTVFFSGLLFVGWFIYHLSVPILNDRL